MKDLKWSLVLIKFTYLQSVLSLTLLAVACIFFFRLAIKTKVKEVDDVIVPEIQNA